MSYSRLAPVGAVLLRSLAAWLLFACSAGSAHALEPPRQGEIEWYRQNGTLTGRAQSAWALRNHRFSPSLVDRKRDAQSGTHGSRAARFPYETALPAEGSPRILALLVEFPDYPHTNSETVIADRLFGDGDAADAPFDSLRSFYSRSSYGRLSLDGDVLGWYRARYNRAYYQPRDPSMFDQYRAQALIKEVLAHYDAQGHDFSQYDNNGDGRIDYFALFWAGPDTGWSGHWWGFMVPDFTDGSFRLDGKSLGGFSWQWEANPVGSGFDCSTIAHETGHALGLPDYYDYDGSVGPDGGVGGIDLMDASWGDHNCFSKWMLGWLTPTVVASAAQARTYSLRPAAGSPDCVLAMPGGTASQPFAEYFMVQSRSRTGNDSGLPADGLLVWHVDARLNEWGTDFRYDNSYTDHKLLRLMEADGLEQIARNRNADAGDFYRPGGSFGPSTAPNSRSYSGAATDVTVNTITQQSGGFSAYIGYAGGGTGALSLAFTVQPGTTLRGQVISPAVKVAVRDGSGSTATTATGTIALALASNPSGAALQGTTSVTAVAGVATFSNLSLDKAGTGYTLVASASGMASATSGAFSVTAPVALRLAFVAQPSNTTGGSRISPAVKVAILDENWRVVPTSTQVVTVVIGANPRGGTLSGTRRAYAIKGVAPFAALSIDRASGSLYTLDAFSEGLAGATSAAFYVSPGPAARLSFLTQPSDAPAGEPITPAVRVAITDLGGNVVQKAAAPITVTLGPNGPPAILSGTLTMPSTGGIATFADLSLRAAGANYSLTAAATGLASAASTPFTIRPGPAARLLFTSQPRSTTGGTAFSPAVRVAVQDVLGNNVTTATAPVAIAIGTNPRGGVLSGTTSAVPSAGVATFTGLRLDRASALAYTLVASAPGLPAVTSTPFLITIGPAAKLLYLTQPGAVVAGAALAPAVRVAVTDAGGNVVTRATGSVAVFLGINRVGGTLSGTMSVPLASGVASFSNLHIDRADTYTLRASAPNLPAASSALFAVRPGIASRLAFTGQPSSVVAGDPIEPRVRVTVQDAFGNTAALPARSITVSLGANPGGGTLSGTRTVTTSGGSGLFFGLRINQPGTGYTLRATSAGLAGGISAPFVVLAR